MKAWSYIVVLLDNNLNQIQHKKDVFFSMIQFNFDGCREIHYIILDTYLHLTYLLP